MQNFDFFPAKVVAKSLNVHWAWLRDRRLRGQFIEGIHYRKVPGIREYCFCETLVRDWINCGGDLIAHQPAIDSYLLATGRIKHRGEAYVMQT